MVSTLVWVVTQVAMVGMGVGDASAAPTSAEIGPVEAEISTVDSTRTAASGSHGAPAGDNSPASPVSHRLCPWCAKNAGIGPVQGGFSHLPQPQDTPPPSSRLAWRGSILQTSPSPMDFAVEHRHNLFLLRRYTSSGL